MQNQAEHAERNARLRAEFRSWKDRQTMLILSDTESRPEEINRKWARLMEREQAFENNLATPTEHQGTHATKGGSQP